MSTQGGRWSKKSQNLVDVVCERPQSVDVYVVNSKANKQAYGKPGLLKNDFLIKPKSLCTFHNNGFTVYLCIQNIYKQAYLA